MAHSNKEKPEMLDKMYKILDSKLFLLIVAALLASQLCPQWLSPLASISADRQWKLNMREKALTTLDEGVLYYLFVLEEQCDDTMTMDKLKDTRKKALIEMNKSLVQIRLLYGTKIMEAFKNDIPKPIGDLYQEAIKARADKKKMIEFKANLGKHLKTIEGKVDYWEDFLSKLEMIK